MNKKILVTLVAAFLAACGGGEDSPSQPAEQPTRKPPESGVCQTTVPIPPDCPLTAK